MQQHASKPSSSSEEEVRRYADVLIISRMPSTSKLQRVLLCTARA